MKKFKELEQLNSLDLKIYKLLEAAMTDDDRSGEGNIWGIELELVDVVNERFSLLNKIYKEYEIGILPFIKEDIDEGADMLGFRLMYT